MQTHNFLGREDPTRFYNILISGTSRLFIPWVHI